MVFLIDMAIPQKETGPTFSFFFTRTCLYFNENNNDKINFVSCLKPRLSEK